jgi:hypothetical protein
MAVRREILFVECQRCHHKGQREVPFLPLPPGARFRCSACGNRDAGRIRTWTTSGSSASRVLSFPRGKPTRKPM